MSISLINQRIDCNRGVGKATLTQHNCDISSDVQEFVGDPSLSVEALEVACGDGILQIVYKCTKKICLLSKHFFKPNNHIIRIVTHHSYPCVNVN